MVRLFNQKDIDWLCWINLYRELGMSKAAFKRAIGRLMKEGAIELTNDGIRRNW